MAELDPYHKSQQLVSEIASTTPRNQVNPCKFYSGFLYKALFLTLFLAILPLFPSQAPEFINQTVFNRSWELLHLVFVGIAVSYGLFSRRNDEIEKENISKFDNAQSYVSRFLQVSSVFDEEIESPSGSGETKVQTWSNQYHRGEPVVVVTKESSVHQEQSSKGGKGSIIGDKPLLLPVRSLKSRVSESGDGESGDGDGGGGRGARSLSRSGSGSISGSKRSSMNRSKTKNAELGGFDPIELGKKLEENIVLPSPIPWRSRSGRMEMKEEGESHSQFSFPPSMEESKINKLEKSRSFRSHTSASSSPNKLSPSPSPSLSSESLAKSVEDFVRKKSFYKAAPPPPPPPPPPPTVPKDLRRSMTSDTKDLSRNGREDILRRSNSGVETISMGKSVRTLRAGESVAGIRKAAEVGDDEKKPKEVAGNMAEKTGRKMVTCDQVPVGIDRVSHESIPSMSRPTTHMEYEQGGEKELSENIILDSDEESRSDEEQQRYEESSDNEEEAASSSVGDGGQDVNKKADEFIAKFREQIRLQRIESIKRSSALLSKNLSK